jgi:ABC-type lipoprotein export system ATPase subunit
MVGLAHRLDQPAGSRAASSNAWHRRLVANTRLVLADEPTGD